MKDRFQDPEPFILGHCDQIQHDSGLPFQGKSVQSRSRGKGEGIKHNWYPCWM